MQIPIYINLCGECLAQRESRFFDKMIIVIVFRFSVALLRNHIIIIEINGYGCNVFLTSNFKSDIPFFISKPPSIICLLAFFCLFRSLRNYKTDACTYQKIRLCVCSPGKLWRVGASQKKVTEKSNRCHIIASITSALKWYFTFLHANHAKKFLRGKTNLHAMIYFICKYKHPKMYLISFPALCPFYKIITK